MKTDGAMSTMMLAARFTTRYCSRFHFCHRARGDVSRQLPMSAGSDRGATLAESLGDGYTIEGVLDGDLGPTGFLVRDRVSSTPFVVALADAPLDSENVRRRWMKEIGSAAALDEPHILPLAFGGITRDGMPYYAEPLPGGQSLHSCALDARFGMRERIDALRDVAAALAYAHKRGIVHENLTPRSIHVDGGITRVAQFGVVKAVRAVRSLSGVKGPVEVHAVSPDYQSPEQLAGEEVDGRSDLYAWAVIAYELLAGEHPFADKLTSREMANAHREEVPVHLLLKASTVPATLANVVMRCLSKAPAQRPNSAAGVVLALQEPEVVELPLETGEASARWQRPAAAVGKSVGLILLVVLIFWGGRILSFVSARVPHAARPAAPAVTRLGTSTEIGSSVVILSFLNADDGGYLSSGMRNEIAHALSHIPALRVAGRASSSAFGATSVNPVEAARSLQVDAAISGTLITAGDRVRLDLQLARVGEGQVIWSSSFEAPKSDLLSLQDRIIREVTPVLAPSVTADQAGVVGRKARGTASAPAYDAFLRGMRQLSNRTPDSLAAAVTTFRQALALDSTYARAWAGLASSYLQLASTGTLAPDSAEHFARVAAARSAALDSGSADAQLAMGSVHRLTLRFTDAERSFRRAVAVESGSADARLRHAESLVALGRLDEGTVELRAALALDPLSPFAETALAYALLAARHADMAGQGARRALARDSTLVDAALVAGNAYVFGGFPDSAVQTERGVFRQVTRYPGLRGGLLLALAAAGQWEAADSLRAEIATEGPGGSAFDRMMSGLVYRDHAAALSALEGAESAGSDIPLVVRSIGCDPVLDQLKAEPRYVALLARRGLTACPATTAWPVKPRRK